MASPSQAFTLSLSLDASLRPFLTSSPSPRPSHSYSTTTTTRLLCSPAPQTQNTTSSLITTSTGTGTGTGTSIGTATFLSPVSLSKLETLTNFSHTHHFPPTNNDTGITGGTLLVRPMYDSEIDAVSDLLSQSFIQTLFLPPDYAKLLAFLVKDYLIGRRALLPHAALLVGFYSPDNQPLDDAELACTAEISFDERGANAASPTPVPPPDCPYICNMTVKDTLRRRGIGKQLLKTCEDLISKMTDKRHVYLHCRMVDKVPLSMYKKAGYHVIKTDSILVWLTLQRRKHLMRKRLPDCADSEVPKSEEA